MLRGSIVIVTALMSKFILKHIYYRHHITSLFMVVGGIAIVGYSQLILKGYSQNTAMGLALILIAQIF